MPEIMHKYLVSSASEAVASKEFHHYPNHQFSCDLQNPVVLEALPVPVVDYHSLFGCGQCVSSKHDYLILEQGIKVVHFFL